LCLLKINGGVGMDNIEIPGLKADKLEDESDDLGLDALGLGNLGSGDLDSEYSESMELLTQSMKELNDWTKLDNSKLGPFILTNIRKAVVSVLKYKNPDLNQMEIWENVNKLTYSVLIQLAVGAMIEGGRQEEIINENLRHNSDMIVLLNKIKTLVVEIAEGVDVDGKIDDKLYILKEITEKVERKNPENLTEALELAMKKGKALVLKNKKEKLEASTKAIKKLETFRKMKERAEVLGKKKEETKEEVESLKMKKEALMLREVLLETDKKRIRRDVMKIILEKMEELKKKGEELTKTNLMEIVIQAKTEVENAKIATITPRRTSRKSSASILSREKEKKANKVETEMRIGQ
jgi:hypothetical protein